MGTTPILHMTNTKQNAVSPPPLSEKLRTKHPSFSFHTIIPSAKEHSLVEQEMVFYLHPPKIRLTPIDVEITVAAPASAVAVAVAVTVVVTVLLEVTISNFPIRY